MNVKMKMRAGGMAAAAVLCGAGAVQAAMGQPGQGELTRAATRYLADHGDLCMAKYTWPRDVTPADRDARTNDAVQLPVLEHLGLVESAVIPAGAAAAAAASSTASSPAPASGPVPEPGRRYSLTAKGRGYYLQKKRTTLNVHGEPVAHDGDFCVAHLTLDKVAQWSPPEQVGGHLETLVRYTYHVEPAAWMADADARKAFPVADRIIRGDRTLQMTMTARLDGDRWVPVLPGQ